MSSPQIFQERVRFGRDIPPEVNACLQQAVACANDFEQARAWLYRARDIEPDQLEVYIALYKFCFYRGHLDEAESIALQALQQSARRGEFDADWQQLDSQSADWCQDEGPARVYLYSLKALSFIRLRKGEQALARQQLDKLRELDVNDLVGASVIMDLAQAMQETDA